MQIIDAITRDVLRVTIALRELGPGDEGAAAAHRAVCDQMDRMIGRALAADLPRDDVYAIVFAIASLADSLAGRDKGALASWWREASVVAHYFGENETAGDPFMERLEALRRRGRPEVLRVFATCVALGYRGRLRPPAAQALLDELVAQLEPGVALSRSGPRPRRPLAGLRPAAGLPSALAVPLLALAVAGALYVVLSAQARTDAVALVGQVDGLQGGRP